MTIDPAALEAAKRIVNPSPGEVDADLRQCNSYKDTMIYRAARALLDAEKELKVSEWAEQCWVAHSRRNLDRAEKAEAELARVQLMNKKLLGMPESLRAMESNWQELADLRAKVVAAVEEIRGRMGNPLNDTEDAGYADALAILARHGFTSEAPR